MEPEVPPPPPPPVDAGNFGDRFRKNVGAVILIGIYAGLGFVNIPVLSWIPARSVDIVIKGGYVAAHWPSEDLCAQPFCFRTDTTKKHALGRPNYTSETKIAYCPDHKPSFIDTNSRIDGCFAVWYWLFVVMITGGVLAVLGAIVVRLLAWPVILPLHLMGKIPRAHLFTTDPGEAAAGFDRTWTLVGGIAGIIFAAAGVLMYMWW